METIRKWNNEYGPVIKLKMGKQDWIMLTDPYLAHEIFATNGLIASDRPVFTFSNLYSYGGLGVSFSNPTKRWKKARTALLEVLAPPRVNGFTDILDYESDCMVEQLLTRTAQQGQLDPMLTLNVAALNVVLMIVYGQRVESVDDPFFKLIMDFVRPSVKHLGVEGPISQFLPVFGFLDTLMGTKRFFLNYLATVRDPLLQRLIEQGVQSDKDCLIKSFLEYDIDRKDLIVMMSDMILAGTDTVSISLAWLLIFVSNYPDVQKKLHAEIDGFYNTHQRLPTFKDRDQLPYMICVQKECIRHRSTTVFGLPHVVTQDLVVRDYLIPKNTAVLANFHGMHMNPDVYLDPESFNPDRFLDNTKTMMAAANGNVNARDHFNFGFGRRTCPGIHMAEVEMFNACTKIFAHCVVAPPLDADGKESPVDMNASYQSGIVLLPYPHQLRFLPRTDSPLESPLKSSTSSSL
ncbi:hypothetical protein [Absidia glauca]|uniref:Cytochrome P450 n=1 Tax=Absidia glauca TaxID=4829 RepID=A0A168N278_ABSGL|nr:hypothetical protein [Absidia glauca]